MSYAGYIVTALEQEVETLTQRVAVLEAAIPQVAASTTRSAYERCAQIADEKAKMWNDDTAHAIAAAIRAELATLTKEGGK